MNTEQLKDLHFALMCLQDEYDPVYEKEQYDMFGSAINAINLLRVAEKRIAELESNARLNQQARDELLERAIKAEAELARRDALEPVAYYANDAYYNTERAALKDGADEVTPLYEVAPGMALPVVKLPTPYDVEAAHGDISYRHCAGGDNFDRSDIISALDTANVKWEVKK